MDDVQRESMEFDVMIVGGGPAGVFIFDLADSTLRPTDLQPTDRYTADFFVQNRACAALREQLG